MSKILTAYFSASGVTKSVALKIAKAGGESEARLAEWVKSL